MTKFKFKKQEGFTLIELIVVMAVFFFIVGAVIGIFISIIQNQKKVLAEQQLLNQISYVKEHVSKALRMASVAPSGSTCISQGYIYSLTHYDIGSGTYKGIKFINGSENDICQEFFWDSADSILKETKNGAPVPLTSSTLQINSVRFAINGSATGCGGSTPCGASNADFVQPRVTILLNVKVPGDSKNPTRTIQTTVSQRNLNIKY